MARALYPHDSLADVHYARVIASVDSEANDDRLDLLRQGVKTLDGMSDAPFRDLSEERKVEVLSSIQGTPFFEDVRTATVRRLYNNPQIWSHFGYEGPSALLGGYMKRSVGGHSWIPDE